jgi:hypothetical protein
MTTNAGNPGPPGGSARHDQIGTITTLLTEQDAAALLHVSVKSIQGWRSRGGGPRFVKVGRCVRYRREDLQAFVLAALRTSTSDPGPALPGRPGIRVEPLLETTGRRLDRQAPAPALPPGKPR